MRRCDAPIRDGLHCELEGIGWGERERCYFHWKVEVAGNGGLPVAELRRGPDANGWHDGPLLFLGAWPSDVREAVAKAHADFLRHIIDIGESAPAGPSKGKWDR